MEDKDQPEIEKFMAAVVQGCAKYIVSKEDFCFDIKFEVNGRRYQISLMQDKEFGYLKDN